MVRHAPPTFSDHYSNSMNYILIGQYSRRQLTFSMDILKAFSGVLHAYENLTSPVRHFWGIPIIPHESFVLESFSMGLSWEFSDTATFSHQASLPRREIFPTESPVGPGLDGSAQFHTEMSTLPARNICPHLSSRLLSGLLMGRICCG